MSQKVKQSKELTWYNCDTYTDVLCMMRKFINGEINYYPGYDVSMDKGRATIDAANDKKYIHLLLKLNDIGCLTYGGQSYKLEKKTDFFFSGGVYVYNGTVYDGNYMEREYISFYYKLKKNQNMEDICNKMKNNGMYYNICDYIKKVCYKHYDITDEEQDIVTRFISNMNEIYPLTCACIEFNYDEVIDYIPDFRMKSYKNIFVFTVMEDSWEKKDEYLIERIFKILESN